MRNIRIFAHISLDGVIAPGGTDDNSDYANGGWTAPYRSAAGAQAVADAQGESYDLLLGRRTYDLWAGFWPRMNGGPFADRINSAKKFVATHTPQTLSWGPAQGLGPDIIAGVCEIISKAGPDLIVWGSTTLTSSLLEAGLIHELVLIVYPMLLGQGKRFFSDHADPRELILVSSTAMSAGVLINRYRHIGPLSK